LEEKNQKSELRRTSFRKIVHPAEGDRDRQSQDCSLHS